MTIHGGHTSTTKYYSAAGKAVAMRKDGVLSYLVPGSLGSVNLTLYADGSTESVQLYAPYGATRYSDGTISDDLWLYGTALRHDNGADGLWSALLRSGQ